MLVSGVGAVTIAALIGPGNKGTLATLSAVSFMVSIVLSLGMDGAARYYIATNRWSLPQASAVILAITTAAGALSLAGFTAAHAAWPSLPLLVDLPPVVLTAATVSTLLGGLVGPSIVAVRRFAFWSRLAVISAAVNPLLFLALRLLGATELTSALWGYVGGQAALALPGLLHLLSLAGWRLSRPNDLQGATWYGLRSLGSHLFNLANLRLDVLMLRTLSTASATGAYSLATQLTEAVWLVPSSVGVAAFPEIAEGGHSTGAWTARLCRIVSSFSVMLSLVGGAAATALVFTLLPAYKGGIPALWLLLPGTIAASIAQILNHDLNARGRPEAPLAGSGAALVVTVVGALLLVPRFGVNGAAAVSSLAYSTNAFVLALFFLVTTGSAASVLAPRRADARRAIELALETIRDFRLGRSEGTNVFAVEADGAPTCMDPPDRRRQDRLAFLGGSDTKTHWSPVARGTTGRQRVLFSVLRYSGLPLLVRELIQRRRITIIDYHAVSPEVLDFHLSVLRKRYNLIELRDCVRALETGRVRQLPPRPMVVTIDDGHSSVRDLAQTCQRHGVRPTVFLCSGLVDTDRHFWWMLLDDQTTINRLKHLRHAERVEALMHALSVAQQAPQSSLSLCANDVMALREGFDFQAHSVFHPILTTCCDERSKYEIEKAKSDLEQLYGLQVFAFAYPDGAHSARDTANVQNAGYECAVTCEPGFNGARTDVMRLRRIGMGDGESTLPTAASGRRLSDVNEVIVRATGIPAIAKAILGRLLGLRRQISVPDTGP